MSTSLFNKRGSAAVYISRDLLSRKENDRLPPIYFYSETLGFGRGTVQAALEYIINSGAIEIQSRGRMGSFLTKIEHRKLWEIQGGQTLVGTMPLPYSLRYEGLASGLYENFSQSSLPFILTFMRGSQNRLEALNQQRCDFAVVSQLCLDVLGSTDTPVITNLGPSSYVSEHVVIFSSPEARKIESGMSIGIDPSSIDQSELTKAETRGKSVRFIEMPYTQIAQAVREGKVEAAIWNRDDFTQSFEVPGWADIQTDEAREKDVLTREAVIVAADEATASLLRYYLDNEVVSRIQNEVLSKARTPRY